MMSPGLLYVIELNDQYGRLLGVFTAKLREPTPDDVRLNLIRFDNGVLLHDRCSFQYHQVLDPDAWDRQWPREGVVLPPVLQDLDDTNVPSKGASQRIREGLAEIRERGFTPTKLIAHPDVAEPAGILALEFGLPLELDPNRPSTSPGNLVVGFEGDAPDLDDGMGGTGNEDLDEIDKLLEQPDEFLGNEDPEKWKKP